MECAGIAPVLAADIATVWAATNVDYDAQDYVSDDSGHFDDGEDKFSFTIALDAEKVDADDQHQKNGDPGVIVDRSVRPVLDGKCCGHDLQRQYD